MTTINDTVNQSLAANGLGNYAQQAQPVKDALLKREQDMAGALLEAATAQGISPEDATRVFEGVGMHLPTAQADDPQEAVTLDQLAQSVAALVAFARTNGFRG